MYINNSFLTDKIYISVSNIINNPLYPLAWAIKFKKHCSMTFTCTLRANLESKMVPQTKCGQTITYNLWDQSRLIPVFVNKVLLEHCYAYLFICCWWLLSSSNSHIESLQQKLHGMQILKYLVFVLYRKKKIGNFCPEQCFPAFFMSSRT